MSVFAAVAQVAWSLCITVILLYWSADLSGQEWLLSAWYVQAKKLTDQTGSSQSSQHTHLSNMSVHRHAVPYSVCLKLMNQFHIRDFVITIEVMSFVKCIFKSTASNLQFTIYRSQQ